MEPSKPAKNRTLLVTVIILIILILAGVWAWRHFAASPEKAEGGLPLRLNVANVQVTEIDGEHVKLTTQLAIANPLPLGLHTSGIRYELYMDTALVVKSDYKKAIELKAADSTVLALPMEVSLKRLAGIMDAFEKQHADSADYRMKATVYFDVPVAGEKQREFEFHKRLPAILMPRFEVADTDIKGLSLKNMGIDLVLVVANPNSFPMHLRDGKLKLTINETLKLDAVLPAELNLKARSRETVPIHIDMKASELGRVAWKALFDKKDTPFSFEFSGVVASDNQMLDDTKLLVKAHGNLAQAFRTVKELK